MDEVGVHRREIVAVIERVQQLLAHADQRRGAARREIEAAEQLLPARFGGGVDLGRGLVGGRRLPGGNGGVEPRPVGAEPVRQRLEEGDARADRQFAVLRQNFAGQRHAGGFAAA